MMLEQKDRDRFDFSGTGRGMAATGFSSLADDFLEGKLDLNDYLIKHPAATFFVRMSGDAMVGAGIYTGDLLIVDRALEPADGKVVLAVLEGELIVRRLCRRKGKWTLTAANEDYEALTIDEGVEFEVWGVVTYVIHAL
jgi:DNA polymerase V